MHIGNLITEWQEARAFKWVELARALGKPPQEISRVRRQEDPRLSVVLCVSAFLGLSLDEFLAGPKKTPRDGA